MRELVAIVMGPMVGCLRTESGRSFLRIDAARVAHDSAISAPSPAMADLRARLQDHLPAVPAEQRRERARLTGLIVAMRLGRRAEEEARGVRRPSRAVLTRALVDAVTAVLATPGHGDTDLGTLDQ